MKLEIEGIDNLGGWTDDRISVLYCVGQRDLYAIEFMYNDGIENQIYYLIIMRSSAHPKELGWGCYLVNYPKGMAYPLRISSDSIRSKRVMMSSLRTYGEALTKGSLNGGSIKQYNDIKNLVFG
jgi:hypothetical protein